MDKKEINNTDLIIRKQKAFEAIYLKYYGRVREYICGIIKSQDDAEEVAQDVFVKLWGKRDEVDLDSPISKYIHTIARNEAFNFLKSKFANDNRKYDPLHDIEIIDVVNVENTIYAKEIELLIKMAISQMPDQRRTIFELSRYEGLSNKEIAEKLNIADKTVENQISLAIGDLRKNIWVFLLFLYFM